MAPPQSQDKSLNADQVKLLCEVMTQAKVALTPAQWNDIASNLGISNGKAAKERFRYMMNSLTGTSSRAAKHEDSATDPTTPKSAAKKGKAPVTPASTKSKSVKASAKKRKTAALSEEEDGTMNDKDEEASEAVEEQSAPKTPKSKKAKKLDTPFQTPKKAKRQDGDDDDSDGYGNGDEADSDTTKVEASMYSGTTQADTPKPEHDEDATDTKDLDIETYFQEEGFGTIGGGDGSMFPGNDDLV